MTNEQLVDDLRNVLAEAEDLLGPGSSVPARQAARLRQRLAHMQEKLTARAQNAADATRQAAKDADVWVHDNPWQSVGVAAGIGMLFGALLGRRGAIND
jgi:ElaB/YqjD/DUF883 family membrane-anchored ribosome-binding protein